ncbi:MAG: hypothetical protein FWG89_07460 [Treponema sp.]|nr:hypothetical protein [Treponema sp.]
MKKNIHFISFIAAIYILSGFSCTTMSPEVSLVRFSESTAAPVSPPVSGRVTELVIIAESTPASPQVTGQNQALQAQLDTAKAKAEEARTRADDFDSSLYFPSDWEAAEEQFANAGQLPQNNENETRRVIEAYTASANSYDSLFNLTIPLYAQAREDEIMALREFLIDQGIRQYFPEYLAPADATAIEALELFEAEDYYAARESADAALQKFNTLTLAHNALLKKWEIDARDFILYDMDSYELAGEAVTVAIEAYTTGDFSSAFDNAQKADLHYGIVLSAGWIGYAEIRSLQAASERQAALDTKTEIGAREYFEIADSSYTVARELLEEQNFEEASKVFHYAEAMYVIASMASLEKKRMAAAAIIEANERILESDATAFEADAIIEGGR